MPARALLAPLLLLSSLLAACGESRGLPSEWGALRAASGDRCPTLIGRYVGDELPAAWALALRRLDPGTLPEVRSFAVADQQDSSLLVTVTLASGGERRINLRRGGPWEGDYHCDEGWLVLRDGLVPDWWDDELRLGDHAPRRRTIHLAPARDGALVARLEGEWFETFSLWAETGAGVPLPWTWRTARWWSRVQPYREDAPPRRLRAQAGARRTEVAPDPVMAADAALEQLPDAPGREDAERLVLDAMPRGMRLQSITPRDSGWHVSVALRDAVMASFLTQLTQDPRVAEVRHDVLVRTRLSELEEGAAVYVRLVP